MSTNNNEKCLFATVFGGHITGNIVNMRYFKLRNLDDYKVSIEIPRSEPQHQIFVDAVGDKKIYLTNKSLIKFGKEEAVNNSEKPLYLNNWGGWDIEYRKILFMAEIKYAKETLLYETDDTTAMVYYIQLSKLLNVTVIFLTAVLTADDNDHQSFMWKEAQKQLKLNRDGAIKKLSDVYRFGAETLKELTDDVRYEKLIPFFDDAVNRRFKNSAPTDISYFERIYFGNILFLTLIRFYKKFSRSDSLTYDYTDIFEDELEIPKTTEMHNHLLNKDYDFVINYQNVTTFRADYLRGQAHFFKGEYDNARVCFEKFLDVVNNPKCLGDIITGALSVQYSYYYLGVVYQKLGDLNKAVNNYAKCRELTEKLYLGLNLCLKGLGIDDKQL